MKNIYFPEEDITRNDLYFVCYMIERVARKLYQKNNYVANMIGKDKLEHLLSVANVLHSENPLAVEIAWINEYALNSGSFHIDDIDKELVSEIPNPTKIAKVYTRLILETLESDENLADAILRIYNNPICDYIDNYNCSAFYEPSYVITRAYYNNGF